MQSGWKDMGVMRSRHGLIAGLAVVLASCATPALRQFKETNGAAEAAITANKACMSALTASPAYSDLAQHLPLSSAAPSLEQLADPSVPTSEQVAALLDWHKGVQICRQQFLDAAQASFPFMVVALQQDYAEADNLLLRLALRQASFGEVNRQISQLRVAANARNIRAYSAWKSDLQEENREELAQRAAAFQAAAASLQQAGAAMQQQAQQQQLLNAINRPVVISPVTTTCNQFGNQTNCTSR